MPHVSALRSPPPAANSSDPRLTAIIEAVKTLIAALPPEEQARVLREAAGSANPPAAPKAGVVLGTIVKLLPKKPQWSVDEVRSKVRANGVTASNKEIYNALGYLNRRGLVQRIGYGIYKVDGNILVTSDDLGGEPSKDESY